MINPFEEIATRLDRIENLLHSQFNRKLEPVIVESEKPMNIKQAAAFLSTTPGAVYQLKHYGKIPYSKQGGRLYFFEKELRSWIHRGRGQTVGEIQAESIRSLSLG